MKILGIVVGAFLVLGIGFIEPAKQIKLESTLCRSNWQPGMASCPVDWSMPLIVGGLIVLVAASAYLIRRVVTRSPVTRAGG